jgi:hypothetical protein
MRNPSDTGIIGACRAAGSLFCFLLPVLCLGIQTLNADLGVADIENVYGTKYELIDTVPGRPWIDMQYRYQLDNILVRCNFVNGRCLWIDYWVNGKNVDEKLVFSEIDKLFPGEVWTPRLFHGRPRWWFNQNEDRITLRAKGFTIHMNEYIKNVLSRREQWQF